MARLSTLILVFRRNGSAFYTPNEGFHDEDDFVVKSEQLRYGIVFDQGCQGLQRIRSLSFTFRSSACVECCFSNVAASRKAKICGKVPAEEVAAPEAVVVTPAPEENLIPTASVHKAKVRQRTRLDSKISAWLLSTRNSCRTCGRSRKACCKRKKGIGKTIHL